MLKWLVTSSLLDIHYARVVTTQQKIVVDFRFAQISVDVLLTRSSTKKLCKKGAVNSKKVQCKSSCCVLKTMLLITTNMMHGLCDHGQCFEPDTNDYGTCRPSPCPESKCDGRHIKPSNSEVAVINRSHVGLAGEVPICSLRNRLETIL
ncbi:hypothetical protein OUZ56_019235 [Daphnia magna]|uniref:Uncharacterized protein n=1 Tax=Daphnia magna TaxID=35525 RepID=A0ABQ9ZC41_9CRUS|nr:hypothetical protein OUZ56_019235 [Daphnia magna]